LRLQLAALSVAEERKMAYKDLEAVQAARRLQDLSVKLAYPVQEQLKQLGHWVQVLRAQLQQQEAEARCHEEHHTWCKR
jgi:hypothetical protein